MILRGNGCIIYIRKWMNGNTYIRMNGWKYIHSYKHGVKGMIELMNIQMDGMDDGME